MIEIIREETKKDALENECSNEKGLPKEIRQIGNADIGDRIYLGEKVYQYMHRQIGWENETFDETKKVFVLLGKMEDFHNQKCIFVEYAIVIEEMEVVDGVPIWNDSTWGFIFKKMKHVSEEMIVVGWAMDVKGGIPSLASGLARVHMTHFGGRHQIFFLMDSLEKEENFFSNKQGELHMREGFYLYRDRNSLAIEKEKQLKTEVLIEHAPAQEEEKKDSEDFWNREMKSRERREQIELPFSRKKRFRLSPTYVLAAATMVLLIAAYRNNVRMKDLQETLSQMNVAQTMFAETDTETEQPVSVETLTSSLEKESTEENAQTMSDTQQTTTDTSGQAETSTGALQTETTTESTIESTTETATTETIEPAESTATISAEAQTYIDQGYYIVQKGDSLAGICMKLYQTTAMMDKICEANEIENADEIYAGQCLTLPK